MILLQEAQILIDDVAVIIPTYNEGAVLESTVSEILKHFSQVIVVDDGSKDNSSKRLKIYPCTVLRHITNLGQGAAIQTGVVYAIKNTDCRFFLTFDADGQHSITSAIELCKEIAKNDYDIVLGSRFLGRSRTNAPLVKRLLLKLAVFYTRIDTGLKLTDTHNGLRVFNRRFANALNIKQHGMAHASEILNIISSEDFHWKESPVDILYTEHSLKKGQSILNSINILTERIFR